MIDFQRKCNGSTGPSLHLPKNRQICHGRSTQPIPQRIRGRRPHPRAVRDVLHYAAPRIFIRESLPFPQLLDSELGVRRIDRVSVVLTKPDAVLGRAPLFRRNARVVARTAGGRGANVRRHANVDLSRAVGRGTACQPTARRVGAVAARLPLDGPFGRPAEFVSVAVSRHGSALFRFPVYDPNHAEVRSRRGK
jgi:hypothetical protein